MFQIKEETANTWEYEVGNNANNANFVLLWKTRYYVLSLLISNVESD